MPARAAARRTPASGAACDRRQGAPSTAYTSAARWRAPTRAGSLPARATARRAPARQRRHPARPPRRRLEQRPPPRPAPRRLDRRRPPRRCSRAAGCSPGVAGAAPSESTADPSGARNLASVGRRRGVGPGNRRPCRRRAHGRLRPGEECSLLRLYCLLPTRRVTERIRWARVLHG